MDFKIQNERIDDIPVLFEIMKKMKIDKIIDKYFVPHGNWVGLRVGNMTLIWLCYILTTYDHRLSYLSDWVKNRKLLFKKLTGEEIEPTNFSDDRLEIILDYFSDLESWKPFETELNKNTIRVFNLNVDVIRVDATIGQSFSKIIKGGLLQRGNSKHFRDDLPQFKTMLSSLDPLAYPVTSLTVEGNSADDPLYAPVIIDALKNLPGDGHLFVGDAKMGSTGTRSLIDKTSNYYLCPLPLVQFTKLQLLEFISNVKEKEIDAEYIWKGGSKIAKGYITGRWLHYFEGGELNIWHEKLFIIRSYVYANTQISSLVKRIKKAQKDIIDLNKRTQGKKIHTDKDELELVCEKILGKHQVQGLIHFEIEKHVSQKKIRSWKDRPERIEEKTELTVSTSIDQEKLNNAKELLGWQVYATNSQDKNLDITKAVLLYRNEYTIERRFNYLKNKPLNLTPLFLRKENRIIGLIHLLLLALKAISLIEYGVSKSLLDSNESVQGLYPGNPKRKTSKPSISLILRVFSEINLNYIKMGQTEKYMVDMLNTLQIQILLLLKIDKKIYNLYDGWPEKELTTVKRE